jgi:hypothetical protein
MVVTGAAGPPSVGTDGFDFGFNPAVGRGGVARAGEGGSIGGAFAAEPDAGRPGFDAGGSESSSSTTLAIGIGSSSPCWPGIGAATSRCDTPAESTNGVGPGIGTRPPHFPHRALLPALMSGALSFTPQAGHDTSMGMEATADNVGRM